MTHDIPTNVFGLSFRYYASMACALLVGFQATNAANAEQTLVLNGGSQASFFYSDHDADDPFGQAVYQVANRGETLDFFADHPTSAEEIDGSYSYEYMVATVRVDTTGDYLVSIPSSPSDVLYYFYTGGFDPADFATNYYIGNDDYHTSFTALTGSVRADFEASGAACDGYTNVCPASFVTLEANQCYTLVISTFFMEQALARQFPLKSMDLGQPTSFRATAV